MGPKEQLRLMKMLVKSGAIDRVKYIALYEMSREFGIKDPRKNLIMKSVSDLMIQNVFDEKYQETKKQVDEEKKEASLPSDPEYCADFTCKEIKAFAKCPTKCGIHAKLVVALLNNPISKPFDLLMNQKFPAPRKVRSADETSVEKSEENEISLDKKGVLYPNKKARHSFKTRKHGATKTDIVKERITLDVKEGVESDQKKTKPEVEEKIHISLDEEKELVRKNPADQSNKELLNDGTPSKQSEVIDKEKSGEKEGMMITKT